jgi:hypothetical protein
MVYIYVNNHILMPYGYLIIIVGLKPKRKLRAATMLFYSLQKVYIFLTTVINQSIRLLH